MTSVMLTLNCLGLLVVAVLAVAVYLKSKERALLPPGPSPSHLFSGNAKQLYQKEIWKTFTAWGREYGPLTYLRVFTQHMIILNTESAVLDLLDKRSAVYSDRSKQYMYQELMGRKNSAFNISSEHEWFKRYRRLMASELNRNALSKNGGHSEVIQHEVKVLLEGLRDKPHKFERLLRRNTGAIIMKIAYGYTVDSDDDRFLDIVEEGNSLADRFAAPGRWLVDYYPILRYIPAWFPGGGFKREAAQHKAHLVNMTNYPHSWVKQQLEKGNIVGGFTSRRLRPEDGVMSEHEDVVKNVAAGLYAGGGETTVSAMNTFIYVMTTHPHIQARAREEVDAVIGHDRLVTIEDWERLQRREIEMPYLRALTKEILRWGTVAPLGLTHLTTQEDEYMGYRIPKGTAVIANIWGLLHDPIRYPDPFTFNPDRFLSTPSTQTTGSTSYSSLHTPHVPQQDPTTFAFGFGRRVCPGATFAQTQLFLTLVSMLQTFEFKCPVDPVSGKEIVPMCEFSSSIVRHIKPYQTRIIPRPEAELLLD